MGAQGRERRYDSGYGEDMRDGPRHQPSAGRRSREHDRDGGDSPRPARSIPARYRRVRSQSRKREREYGRGEVRYCQLAHNGIADAHGQARQDDGRVKPRWHVR